MAPGARSSGNAGEAAEKLLGLSEQRFLAGDLAGAQRAAREAQVRCRTPLPDLAHALAAYEVHAAAASFSRGSGRNWYAVLTVGARTSLPSGGVTHDDIKRRYRRLCLALHPDKNRSAAADSAFKLLQEAWKALSARHPAAPSAEAKPRSVPTPSPAPPAAASRPGKHARPAPQPAASSPKEAERWRAGDKYCNRSKPRPPPRVFRSVFCGHCGREFRAAKDAAADEQKYCGPCLARPREEPRRPPPPPPAGADTDKGTPRPPPPRRRGSRRFPCPARCAHCGAGYASTVSVGMWHLHCAACHRYAKVHVRSPSNAEAW